MPRDMLKLSGLEQPIRSREAAGSPREATDLLGHTYFEGVVAASRVRPFARRRLRMARPPRVFIRARNP